MSAALRAAAAFALLFLAAAAADGQEGAALRTERVAALHLDDVFAPASDARSVELYLRALTAGGAPVAGLGPKDFLVREDEQRIDSADLEVSQLEDSKRGVSCVLVLDLSPTMREPFSEAKAAASGFLERVGDYDRVAVLTLAGTVEDVADFSASPADARHAIDALRPNDEPAPTRFFDGVYRAVELIRNASDLPRRSLVIVFSDGHDGGSQHTLEEVIDFAKGGVGEPRVPVYAIAYPTGFGDVGLANLRRLTEGTTAALLRVDPGAPISEFYGEIWKQMMKSYLLRFRADLDGEAHRIEVVADGEAADQRAARYPEVGAGIVPWLVGALALIAAGGVVALLVIVNRAGRLVLQSGPERGKGLRLHRGLNRIGQHEDNDVVIAHDTVSRHHAEIEIQGRRVQIRDLDSSNGTWLNDERLEADRPLAVGDRIRVADVDLVYQR